jgi:DNA replication and repair protein RecF
MHFDGLSFQNFRNYSQRTFLFPNKVTAILGENAKGKTSIIEAISLLSTGESFRAERVEEMIRVNEELGRVKGKVDVSGEKIELEVIITRGVVNGKSTQSRLYSVAGVKRQKRNFVGKFFTVVFRPEDMRLVEGSPSRRRQFIDTVLSVVDPEYAVALKTYEESLKKRNRLLQSIQEGTMPRSVLLFWTQAVIKHGSHLQEKRRNFFGSFTSVRFPMPFQVEYLPSVISDERMAEYADREVIVGHMLIGPHKDDFSVHFLDPALGAVPKPVATYGSRGQQRLAVLWLKMAELEFLENQTQQSPLLLLDDILSELDEKHRHDVILLLQDKQAIITTTEKKVVSEIQAQLPAVDVLEL